MDGFWQNVKKLTIDRGKAICTNITLSKCRDFYFNYFDYINLNKLNFNQRMIKQEIDNLREDNSDNTHADSFVPEYTIKKCLKNIKNNHKCGHDKITGSIIKYCHQESLIIHLSILFTIMFKYNIIPKYFNVSKITPIPKDNPSSTDLNDFRPLSISNHFSQIFERLILEKIPIKKKQHTLNLVLRLNHLAIMRFLF